VKLEDILTMKLESYYEVTEDYFGVSHDYVIFYSFTANEFVFIKVDGKRVIDIVRECESKYFKFIGVVTPKLQIQGDSVYTEVYGLPFEF